MAYYFGTKKDRPFPLYKGRVREGFTNLTPFSSPSPSTERGLGGEVSYCHNPIVHPSFVKRDKREIFIALRFYLELNFISGRIRA